MKRLAALAFILLALVAHGFRPVDPGGHDKFKRLIPERKGLPVFHHKTSFRGDIEEPNYEILAFLAHNNLSLGKELSSHRERSRMILFSMVDNDIIDPLNSCSDEIADIFKFFGWIDGINKGGLLTPLTT